MIDERRADDLVEQVVLEKDVSDMLDVLEEVGIGIVPLGVTYAVNAMTKVGIRRIIQPGATPTKSSVAYSRTPASMSRASHVLEERKPDRVEAIIHEERILFLVAAPFRHKHVFFDGVEPFVLGSSTKASSLGMLLNAGQFNDEIARQSRQRGWPVFGSAANTSMKGSKFRYQHIKVEVCDTCHIDLNYGISTYANDGGRSRTIIDFRNLTVIRIGIVFDCVVDAFKRHADVTLKAPLTAGT